MNLPDGINLANCPNLKTFHVRLPIAVDEYTADTPIHFGYLIALLDTAPKTLAEVVIGLCTLPRDEGTFTLDNSQLIPWNRLESALLRFRRPFQVHLQCQTSTILRAADPLETMVDCATVLSEDLVSLLRHVLPQLYLEGVLHFSGRKSPVQ